MSVKLSCCREAVQLGRTEMKVLVVDSSGSIAGAIGPFDPVVIPPAKKKGINIPELSDWTFADASPQISEGYDDRSWRPLEGEPDWDFDSLGNYYGYGWFRGTYKGKMSRVVIDARHCFSVFINGRLIASRDNFRNFSGVGDDVAEKFDISVPAEVQHGGTNTIVIVVESLGHNKDFECDARNPRGIVSLRCVGVKVVWRFRGGLLEGEKGLCPVLDPKIFAAYSNKRKVSLPDFWSPDTEGVGLYETGVKFDLKADDPDPVGIVIPEAFSKANIYVNGFLLGRYWHEKGPQHKFFIPWGILDPKGDNHIAIAVWKRWEAGGLGKVKIESY